MSSREKVRRDFPVSRATWIARKLAAKTLAAFIVLHCSAGLAQTAKPTDPQIAIAEELNKYPGLLPELGVLIDKLKRGVQFPPERTETALLPLFPAATTYYVGVPNYGDAAHQAVVIFQEELKQSSVLRDWWQHSQQAEGGPKLENALEKFYLVSQYLGDEVAVAGDIESKDSKFVLVTQVRKPGLKDFLQQMLKELPEKSKSGLRILDVEELAKAESSIGKDDLIVLVRPDFVVAATSIEAVRKFNAILDAKHGDFLSAQLGQRIRQTYQGGTTMVAAVDLHDLLSHLPSTVPVNQKTLAQSGFDTVNDFVWNHKRVAGQTLSQTELSFSGPRHGIASWLAAPTALDSLDFVSPKSAVVVALALKNFGEIFDDIKDLSTTSNPGAFMMLPGLEKATHVSLRDDIFAQLQGEVTVVAAKLDDPTPQWSIIFRVVDPDRLEKALDNVLKTIPTKAEEFESEGVRYHSLLPPSQAPPSPVLYAITDGYLIISSSRATLTGAIKVHKSGESLAKSTKIRSSIPPGYSPESSMLVYEDGPSMTAMRLRQLSPEFADALSHVPSASSSLVFRAYADERAIRGVSSTGGIDVGAILIGAAVAIPNVMRARTAADESSAVASLRAVNIAQMSYASTYPDNGYARDLASLGPDPHDVHAFSPDHAGLIDDSLAKSNCTRGVWCTKSGYQFTVSAVCIESACGDYVAVATPVSMGNGTRNLCSTSDRIVRFQAGAVLATPVTVSQCRKWPPLR